MEINWADDNILKINNEIDCFACDTVDEKKIDFLRKKIELWLTAIFQSEHFSLLTGTGLTASLTHLAGVTSQGMGRIDFNNFKEEIKDWSNESARVLERGQANIEDDFRTALELLQGLKIQQIESSDFETEINSKLDTFIRAIIKTEKEFCKSSKYNEALGILKSFLISFSSRTATEKEQIFSRPIMTASLK